MLYHLLFPLHTDWGVFNVIQYITFRTAAASLTAFVLSLAFGPLVIKWLRVLQIKQVVRNDGPATHAVKAGTPTMGGLLLLGAALIPTLLWADLTNKYVWIAVVSTASFGAIGFVDDYLKVARETPRGLSVQGKLLAQGVVDAAKKINLSIPLVVRLAGTNVELGKEILKKSNLKIISANNLSEAAQKIIEATR